MEVASCIVKRAKSVTVIGTESVPFERVLGVQIGSALQTVGIVVLEAVHRFHYLQTTAWHSSTILFSIRQSISVHVDDF